MFRDNLSNPIFKGQAVPFFLDFLTAKEGNEYVVPKRRQLTTNQRCVTSKKKEERMYNWLLQQYKLWIYFRSPATKITEFLVNKPRKNTHANDVVKSFGKEGNAICYAHEVENPAAFRKYYKSCKNTNFCTYNKIKRAITHNMNIKNRQKQEKMRRREVV
jgi:hypothetical protein